MTFIQLHSDTACDCIAESSEINGELYGIKTNKNILREVDFKSKWEKGERPSSEDCESVCSLKGVSLSKLNDEFVKANVINIYKKLFPITPSYKPFLSVIKLGNENGKIKKTPLPNNQYHHDFYKCDTFSLTNVELIETISLAEIV